MPSNRRKKDRDRKKKRKKRYHAQDTNNPTDLTSKSQSPQTLFSDSPTE